MKVKKTKIQKIKNVVETAFNVCIFPIYFVLTLKKIKKYMKSIQKKVDMIHDQNNYYNANLQQMLSANSSLKEELEILKIVDKFQK